MLFCYGMRPKQVAKEMRAYFLKRFIDPFIACQIYELFLLYEYIAGFTWAVVALESVLTEEEINTMLAPLRKGFKQNLMFSDFEEEIIRAGGMPPAAAAELAASDLPESFKQLFETTL